MEQDWLKIPKNIPKDNISIDDPNDPMNNTAPETLNSTDAKDMCTDKADKNKCNKGIIVNTEKPTNMTPVTPASVINDKQLIESTSPNTSIINTEITDEMPANKTQVTPAILMNDKPSTEHTSPNTSSFNTEKMDEIRPGEPRRTSIEDDSENTTITENTYVVLSGSRGFCRILSFYFVVNRLFIRDGSVVFSINSTVLSTNILCYCSPKHVNTVNTTVTDNEVRLPTKHRTQLTY